MTIVILTAAIFHLIAMQISVDAQFPIGRNLEPPVPELCVNRTIHRSLNGKGFYFSWNDSSTKNVELDWLDARNWCRKRCMDLVSLHNPTKNTFIKQHIVEGNVKYVWTSGRQCDFKGCDREDLLPWHINGWFWTGNGQKLPPSTDRELNDWSHTGGMNQPQPDNREHVQQNGPKESCLAVLNNFYKDGINWHDVACHHRKPFVCEDSDLLLTHARYIAPTLHIH